VKWHCSNCGDCCRKPVKLYLHRQELDALEEQTTFDHGQEIMPQLEAIEAPGHPGFVLLTVGPCPFTGTDSQGKSVCHAYRQRPYNCRRYMCGRFDCTEPWDDHDPPLIVLNTPVLRQQYKRQQRLSVPWALRHGWVRRTAPDPKP
jgi:Fe-S-cluster containining protein